MNRIATASIISIVLAATALSSGTAVAAVSFGETAKLTPSDASSVDYFGSAVAVDGNTMVIGARSDNAQTGAAYVFSRNSGGSAGWNEVVKLTASDGDYGHYFGMAVAIDGDTIVVGAAYANGVVAQTGAAYVFRRNLGGADAWGEVAKLTASDGAGSDSFGEVVAIDGDSVAVGAPNADGAGSDHGAAYVFDRNHGGAGAWGQVTKISGSSSAGWSYFGRSVAVRGDSLFVGAPNDDLVYIYDRNQGGADNWGETHQFTGSNAGLTNYAFGNRLSVSDDLLAVASHSSIDTGAVWIFERNHGGADSWGEVQRRTAPDGSVGNMYGVAVAVDNNRVLVGASRIDTAGTDAGTAYVFERNHGGADNWGLTQTIMSSDIEAEDYFGEAVAIDGDTVLLGAYGDDVNGNFSGSAYVFSACGGAPGDWQNGFDIYASDMTNGDRFGYAAAVFGDTVIVGAWGDDDQGSDSGSAYLFERNTGGADSWGEVIKLLASDGASGRHFGMAVGIWNDTAVVGGNSAGAVYVFERNTGGADSWGQSARITASDASAGHFLGERVDIAGDTIVAGASYWGTPGHSAIGAAYVFERNSGGPDAWSETAKLMASDAADFDMFGHSAAIDGDTIVIGADRDDDNGADSGSAYVFSRHQGGPNAWGQVAKLTASDGAGGDYFGISVAIDDDIIVVGADRDDDAGTSSGSAYVFERNQGGPNAWGQVAKLTSSDATGGDEFGESVAINGPIIIVGAPRKNPTWGTVYLFSRNLGGADSWGELDKIVNPHSNAGEYFGTATAVTTDIAVIGTPNDWDGSAAHGSITIHRFGCLDYDFGDAPDPSFPTLLASDGPRHELGGGLYLGSSIDMDFDGQPTAAADGDDTDSDGDDDDGVVFTSMLLPGSNADLDVTSSAAGLLNAWIDFNADGDWDDAGEQVFTDQALATGANSLQVAVPADASTDPIIARFRVDSGGGLAPTGEAADGEVEDYALSIVNFDFGDAPDPSFPTLLANDGARHVIVAGFHLGNDVDAEDDGQPNAYANGDDFDAGGDDEDGVAFTSLLLPSHSAGVNVTASDVGVLNAWIDFNSDGDWNDAGEQIFTDQALTSGTNSLNFDVPTTAVTGVYTFARFRFDSTGGLSATGAALDGEVEDERIFIWGLDYGDAPDPTYNTLLASDGARHYVDGALYLGAGVDDEIDGQPSAGADGDDLGGTDDEDGIFFTTPIAGGFTAHLDVTASGTGLLSAWIDFNADGDWSDAGEWVFSDHSVSAGVNPLTIPVPGAVVVGPTYARFRLTTTPGLYPVGTAPDGEVEDYLVEIIEGPDLEIEMTSSPDPVPSGGSLTYTVTVTNNGPLTATSVTVTDTLPGDLTFVSSTPGAPDCTFSTDTLTCDLGTMAPTETGQITIETNLDHPVWGGISNTASVTATETDPDPLNNTATIDTVVGIFHDGFETGSTDRWSATVP
jgi:uncharacterized repeat protein (TIGR01451 family)